MEILVSNLQDKIKLSRKWVKDIASRILKKAGADGELSIVLVDNRYIRRLNRKYRHKDRVTDVLSFPLVKRGQATFSKKAGYKKRGRSYFSDTSSLLGDVVISVERARAQAKEYGHSLNEEIFILIRHGILHLLGYTHRQMENIPV